MAPFVVALLALGLLVFQGLRRRRYGERDPAAARVEVGVVAALLALPLLYAALVLWSAGDRLEGLHLRYVGKRLAWGPGIPLTIGGGEEGAEDLHHPLLAPDAVRLEAANEETAEALGVAPGTGVLRFGPGAPVVRVDGEVANAVALEEGDRIELAPPGASGGEPLVLTLDGGSLVAGELRHPLPGLFERLLRPGRVAYLPDVLADLAPDWSDGARNGYRSMLERDDGSWRLLLRDPELRVFRGDEELASLATPRPVPDAFELRQEVAWGPPGARRLRTARTDHLRLGGEAVSARGDAIEIRFDEPERRRVPPEVVARVAGSTREVGLVVPTAVDRRPELVELDERSRRFHGLAATLRLPEEGDDGPVRLEYLGARWPLAPGELYGLGEGADRMLLRFEAGRSPARVLADLALLALFCAVFLGRPLASSPALSAVVAPVGVLLADRLLFAFRAATEPPHYLARSYGEARLAIWLVPALLLFGWTVAVLLRNAGKAGGASDGESAWQRARRGFGPLGWPLAGLAVAALGCFATVRGAGSASLGNLRALSLVPLALAAVLLALFAWAVGPGGERLGRWRRDGWHWPLWALPAAGGAILLARLAGLAAGMPEALRLPGTDFRILWSALQLPAAALALGLGCQLLAERGWPGGAREGRRGALPSALVDLGAVWLFVALAFLAVGWVTDDLGLVIVHALAPLFALLLVVGAAPGRSDPAHRRSRPAAVTGAHALGVALAVLPLLLVVGVNRWPEPFVAAYDRLASAGAADADPIDDAARYRASPEQQRFRLLMLANPELLTEVGLRPSEQAAVQYQTMKGYARAAGFAGGGYASSELPRHLGVTYLNDLMPMAFVLADFGKLGMLGLALTYLTVLGAAALALSGATSPAGDRWSRQGAWIAVSALLAFALPGLYMILANLNLALFTGKNASLLALNSTSDVLQSGALLGLAAFGLALRGRAA